MKFIPFQILKLLPSMPSIPLVTLSDALLKHIPTLLSTPQISLWCKIIETLTKMACNWVYEAHQEMERGTTTTNGKSSINF